MSELSDSYKNRIQDGGDSLMQRAESYLLGIDLGTTNIKGIILAEDGTLLASASKEIPPLFPGPDMVEQDATAWWRGTVEILRTMTARAGNEAIAKLKGICISSQTVTMLPVDRGGIPLRNALIWMDARSSKELHRIEDRIGFNRYVSIIGGQPDVAFLPNKILWFKNHEPELFEKTYQFLQASSYINFKLSGEFSMDLDQAARSQCMDIETLSWSKEIGDTIGVDLASVLPTPKPVDEIIGYVSERAARETGLISGIPIAAGASDAMASMYAMGISNLGEAGESSGTTSLVFVGSDIKSASNIPIVTKPCAIEGMPWVFDAPISTSGAAIRWYLELFGVTERQFAKEHRIDVYAHLNQLALKADAGSGGLLFFPYLVGERAPLWNNHARGMFIGMSLDMQREELIRSIFEGTAFALKHVIETVKSAGATANCLRISGGGSRSRAWSEIKASMLHIPVLIMDQKLEGAPFGDALIVGHKVGVFPDLAQSTAKILIVKETVEPNPEWEKIYDELFPLYIDMYKHLDHDLIKLKRISKSM